ncbi:MAG: Ig-like domain-containing protein [Bacteroidia bacterium]|nr:Ig-like domain-containing protein [Bacteroidia bacterium]
MKSTLSKFIPAIPVALVLGSMIFSHSCANTTQAPSGGAKDTIPPVVVKTVPKNYCVNVPIEGAEFVFTFDEYVTIKNPKNIFLSPPQARQPKSKLKGKSLIVTIEEPLDSNTTYTLTFPEAIADNNEGNLFSGYTYVFSTGSAIDSMFITGSVLDCSTLDPVKGVTVMLYKDLSDSAIFKSRPYSATKTDDWGFFCLRNIPQVPYRLYAVNDANTNNLYDPDENELVAFVDSVITPVSVLNDSLPEIQNYDMKDTAACRARNSEYEMLMFREKPSRQLIMNQVRVSDRSAYITFNAWNAHIDTMWVAGLPSDRLITQFNLERDSLEIWVNDKASQPDTLHLFVNYRKTDSLGALEPFLEHVKLYYQQDGNKGNTTASKSSKRDVQHNDTICLYKLEAAPETVEQNGYQLELTYPNKNEAFDTI